jgi:hypothetical protein
MTKLKLYWLRFVSKTPEALKGIQRLMGAIAVASAAAIAIMDQLKIDEPGMLSVFKYMAVAAAFSVPILQFATTDKSLQKQDTNETPS